MDQRQPIALIMSEFQLLSIAPLLAMLCTAAIIDWRHRRIPNWLTAVMALSGLAGSFQAGQVASPGAGDSCA